MFDDILEALSPVQACLPLFLKGLILHEGQIAVHDL